MADARTQLTLFVDERDSAGIETIREALNPAQFALIKSHVTLCREHELTDLDRVRHNLATAALGSIVLELGRPQRFSEAKGVRLPAVGDTRAFRDLRRAVLRDAVPEIGTLEPHITLMHPRNSTCTDDLFETIENAPLRRRLTFRTVSLIEQLDGGRWTILETFPLE